MNIKCPHCGTEYEVEKRYMYRYTQCHKCGKGFVVGAATSLIASDSPSILRTDTSATSARPLPLRPQRKSVPPSRPLVATHRPPEKNLAIRNPLTTFSEDEDKFLMSSSLANARFLVKVAVRLILPIVPIAVLLFVKCGLGEKIGDWGRAIGDPFDDSPAYILWRAREPNKSDAQKLLDDSYKSQYGLDFSGYWYDCECPRCGEKLKYSEKLKWVNGSKKVKCSVCDHKWKIK